MWGVLWSAQIREQFFLDHMNNNMAQDRYKPLEAETGDHHFDWMFMDITRRNPLWIG
jgi:hypothetical protein